MIEITNRNAFEFATSVAYANEAPDDLLEAAACVLAESPDPAHQDAFARCCERLNAGEGRLIACAVVVTALVGVLAGLVP